ncbi:MAG: hypothetical protein ACRYFS_15185 [Janthinobacterium lividum]
MLGAALGVSVVVIARLFLSAVAEARMSPMFGEFVVYVDEKVIGQINESRLFIKVTKFREQFAPELESASPYPGAKVAFVVPSEKMANAGCEILLQARAARTNKGQGDP